MHRMIGGRFKMTYGIKKSNGVTTVVMTVTAGWLSHRFVGLGAKHRVKEWRTKAGAQRAADKLGARVFTITDRCMHY